MNIGSAPVARLFLYAALTSLTALSVDALLPGLRSIEVAVSAAPPFQPQHIITVFVFGMVFGELLIGPLSDAAGRKPALIFGLVIYGIGTVLALTASSLFVIILGRFLQGLGVAGPKIATRAIIRDQFEGDAMARVMSFMFTLLMVATLVAPMIGQMIISVGSWRGIFGLYLALALILGLWLYLGHPETLAKEGRIPFRLRPFLSNSLRVLKTPSVLLLTVATGLVFGTQLYFISIAADLFTTSYDIIETFPFYFATLAIALAMATFLNGVLVEKIGTSRIILMGLVGLILISFTFLCFTLYRAPTLGLFMTCMFLEFFMIGLLFGNMNALAMVPLGRLAGLGTSIFSSGSSLVATGVATLASLFDIGHVLIIAICFLVTGLIAFGLVLLALRGDMSPIHAQQ